MKQEIKQLFPSFCANDEAHDLMLSNDIDSLLSCLLLERIKGYKINYFYNWTEFYRTDKSRNKILGVDVDLHKLRCWSNHVTMLSANDIVNSDSANINNVLKISRDNYKHKYAGSTLLQIMSFYNIPLPASEKARMLLLAVDCTFKGWYNPDFQNILKKYLEILEYEQLIEVLSKYKIENFYSIIENYNLHKKLYVDESGFLDTEINLTGISEVLEQEILLPWNSFKLIKKIEKKPLQLDCDGTYTKNKIDNRLFSLALVAKNYVIMNYTSEEN